MIADICFIEGCQETNYFGDSQSSPTFYRFPSDKNLCMQWENVILVHNKQRNGREHNANSKICSKHFVKNDLIRLKVSNQLHIILRENAIPKIFPNFKGSKYDVQILKCGEPDRDNLIEDDDHDEDHDEDDSDDEFGKGSNDIICDPDPDILDEIKSERSSPSSSPSPEKTVQQNDIVTIDLLESSPETNHQYSEIIKIEDTEIMDYDINLQNSDEDDNDDDDDDDDDNFDSIQLINGDFYDGNNSIDYDTNLGELALSNIGKTFTMANGNICIRIPPKIVKQTNNNADALPIISDVDIVKMSSIDSISTIDNTTSIIDTTSTVADLYSTSNASTSLNSTSKLSNSINSTSNSSNNLNSTSTININTCKSPTTTITTTTGTTSNIVNNANNEIIIVPIYNKTGQAIGYERIDPTKPIKVVNKHKKHIEWKFKKQKKSICGSGDSGGGGNPDVDVEPEHCIVTPKNSKNNCNNDPSTIINTNIQSQQHQQQQEQSKQSQLQQSYHQSHHQSHLQSHEQLQQLLEQSQQLLQQSQQSQPQYDELIAPQTFEKYKEAKKNNREMEPSNDNDHHAHDDVDDDITCTTGDGGGGRVGDGNLLTDNEKKLQYNVERQKVLINQLQRMVSNSLTNANRLAQELFRAERQNKLTLNEINEYKQQQQMREQKTEPQSQSQSQEPSPFLKLDNNKTALQRFIISTALLEQSQNEPQQQQQPTTNNNNNQQRTPPPPPPELYPIDVKSFAMNLYKISSASYDYVRIHLPNLPTVRTVTTWINDKTILTTAAGNVINTSDHYRTVPTTSQNNMSTVATVEKHKKRTIKKKSTMPNDKNRKRKEAIKSTKIVSTSFKSSSNKSISELNEHHFNIKSSTTTTNNNTNTNNNISLISPNHLLVDNLSDYTTDFLTDSVMNSIIDCSADDVDVEQDHNITSNT